VYYKLMAELLLRRLINSEGRIVGNSKGAESTMVDCKLDFFFLFWSTHGASSPIHAHLEANISAYCF